MRRRSFPVLALAAAPAWGEPGHPHVIVIPDLFGSALANAGGETLWMNGQSLARFAEAPTPAHLEHDPVQLASAAEFQSLLLSNLQSLICGPTLELDGVPQPEHLVEARISRWFQTIQLRSQRFAQISQDKQHRLRNRIKSLRYCLEFLPSAADKQGLHKVLRECQALIGAVTDVDVALDWYAQHAANPEQAQFARDWLTHARQGRAAHARLRPCDGRLPRAGGTRHRARSTPW